MRYEKEVIMHKLKKVVRFLKNGGRILHEASRCEYTQESKSVTQFRQELFVESDKTDDKINLMKDRKAVSKDLQTAWKNLNLSNG